MKTRALILIPLLAALRSTLATPTTSTTDITAKYDDLRTAPAAIPITTYQGLTYTSWLYATSVLVQVGGVAPQSGSTRIVSGPAGTLAFAPQNPPYKAFAPQDFYYGCSVRAAQGGVGVATSCTFTLKGYSASTGQVVATKTFTFTPPLSPVAPVPMVQAVLPSGFRQKLSKVTVAQADQLTTVLLIDTLHYFLYT